MSTSRSLFAGVRDAHRCHKLGCPRTGVSSLQGVSSNWCCVERVCRLCDVVYQHRSDFRRTQ